MTIPLYLRAPLLLLAVTATLVLSGCANHIKATRTTNPPPVEAYSNYGRIEVKPATLAPKFAGNKGNVAALEKINANLSKRIEYALPEWNKRPDNGRHLVIEPVVSDIRFVGIGTRIWTGPLSGSSAVKVEMKATDVETGKVIDQPEFFQRSSAGSGFAFGVADFMMLTRMGELVGDHILRNYPQAVGSSTGAPEEFVAGNGN